MSSHINKFGVPLDGTKLGMLHTKHRYRFRAVFYGLGYTKDTRVMTQNVLSATRPKLSHEDTELHSYNSIAYIAGKHTWEPVEIVLYDDITNGVIGMIGEQMQKQMNHFQQTAAVSGTSYKFTTEVHTLDGTDREETEKWILEGCYINNYTTPDGDYTDTTGTNQATITLRYDVAHNVAGPNTLDGGTVGGDPFVDTPSPTGGTTPG